MLDVELLTVRTREGHAVPFDGGRIYAALTKCFVAINHEPKTSIQDLTNRVVNLVRARYDAGVVDLESIQDIVEIVLQASGEFDAAKHYILYRAKHAEERAERPVPEEVKAAFRESAHYFPTPLQQFQFFDKYSRFDYNIGRRETWLETVDRLIASFCSDIQKTCPAAIARLPEGFFTGIRHHVVMLRVMPSMRRLAMSGPAYDRDNATQYNCTYMPADGPVAMVEAMLLGMAGCGVGYSVEKEHVEQWPRVKRQKHGPTDYYVVEDSAVGWGKALEHGLNLWLNGEDVLFDTSLVRPAGTPLRTKGGRASGPEPLREMLDFTRRRILARQGSTLRTTDVHDLMCMSGRAAISGGVRRTAQISIFDADDMNMVLAKSGDFEVENSQRWNANNSAVWENLDNMTQVDFMRQWLAMVEGGRGEPGIFNRDAADSLMPSRRERGYKWGVNPCGEIILRPWGMCNLTTVNGSRLDLHQLEEAVTTAAHIGVIQSLGTYFPYLRDQWRINCEEERLLGVSIGGQMDNPLFTGPDGEAIMERLRDVARRAAFTLADTLGINRPAAITCVKPDGNSSQLLNMSSGIHPRWAPYYIRNVRVSASSPLAKVMLEAGVPMNPENGDDPVNPRTWVASFPVKAPEGAITRHGVSAIEQCEFWLRNKLHWTEHNPSVTITYKPHEVLHLMTWVWDHREVIGGMAFLPSFDAKYAQLPYIDITKEEYERRVAEFPDIDFSKVFRYEAVDMTTAAQELACAAGVCEVGQ